MTLLSRRFSPLAGAALLATLSPPPLLAQGVVANELWAAWQEGAKSAGAVLSAVELREGNRLVLQDLRLDTGGDGGVIQLETVTLTNQADGSVGVILPERFPLVIELPPVPQSGETTAYRPEKVVLGVEAPQLQVIVRGIGERADFQANAPQITVSLDRFIPPLPAGQGEVTLSMALEGADLRYLQDLAVAVPLVDGALAFESLTASLIVNGSEDGNGVMALSAGKSSATFSGAVPAGAAESTAEAEVGEALKLLENGLRVSAKIDLGPLAFTGDIRPAGEEIPTAFDLSAMATVLSVGLDAAAIGYEAAVSGFGVRVTADMPDVPGNEISLSLEEYRTSAKAGLNGLRGPQDWSLAYVVRGFGMSEQMWDQLDPARIMPREPMTVALDLAGRYGILPEALAPGWTPAAGQTPLSEFGFRVNEFNLDLVGLTMTGEGGLDLDMTDLTSFDGFPAPSGRLSFLTSGAYGLIDRLVQLGRMTEEDVIGARAALLMIGRAGEASDTLHTDLDFHDKGFFLNGIRIR
ncbi:hypothetical protein [Pseudogemmobacter humi]|uniref:DUF2125 domain-containing protein n=1 Tax=Pseudogemmobacter humi TaxID=2483812 RepID=A0A3P5X7J5_9RHOB|nr:hypothetical protein [Pseudogemmobacter humi]VDC23314.1 hypothetical protein XINFAN_00992 [Pseudogemmobacter humi]